VVARHAPTGTADVDVDARTTSHGCNRNEQLAGGQLVFRRCKNKLRLLKIMAARAGVTWGVLVPFADVVDIQSTGGVLSSQGVELARERNVVWSVGYVPTICPEAWPGRLGDDEKAPAGVNGASSNQNSPRFLPPTAQAFSDKPVVRPLAEHHPVGALRRVLQRT
jgi:hypothetical protein